MTVNTILFMAANPVGTDARALTEQARAIQAELERAGQRDRFRFETRWAAQPLDLQRDMVKLRPVIVHFCGGCLKDGAAEAAVAGVCFQGPDGHARLVPGEALSRAFAAAGSVRLVVLDACDSELHAEAIATHVECVIGMAGDIVDQASTSFSIGMYGGLGEGKSVAAAFEQGCAAISLAGVGDPGQPRLRVRQGVDARQVVFANLSAAINFAAERARHIRFVGREALLAQLDHLLIEERSDRWVVVTGGPGMGKSALLAQWLTRREAAAEPVPHHFIRRGEYDWDDPVKLASSLVAQIVALFPAHPEPEADARMHPAERLRSTLQRISQHQLMPGGQRLVVLFDGLDEYDPLPDSRASAPGRDPLADFLPSTLPLGVSVLCASRPRHPYAHRLLERGALQLDLDAPTFADDNAATVQAFWEQAAPELGLDAQFVARAVDRAAGNPQHAEMLRKHLAALPPEQRQAGDIPRGLAALIARTWERIATESAVVDGLGILCAAREPLTLDELNRVARWTGTASRQAFVRCAREWLIETPRAGRVLEYRLHHDSIRAHVAEAIGGDALVAHHCALAERLANWPAPTDARDASVRRYALHHALRHRAEAGDWADAWRVAADMAFLEAKCREIGVHDAEADVTRTAERCRASGDEHGERFADLGRALTRESHWLRVAPEATPALIWNRLRRFGWTANDLDAELHLPVAADMLRVRHVATRESPALVRSLEGHKLWVTACTVTPDGRHVVSTSADKTLKVWELSSGRELATLVGHTNWVTACAVTPDSRHAISTSWDRTLKVWELSSGRELATLVGHTGGVTACAVMPDGRHVVSASDDKTLKVWELSSGRELATLEGHADYVTACAVTPDGRQVVSASRDKTLKIWDLASGRELASLEGHAEWVTACAVTPDGRHVVSSSVDKTLKVWELASGPHLDTLEGHSICVTACAVTPDGRHVVSASNDSTLKIWELPEPASGRHLPTLEGHTKGVTACAVTPDGRHVVSASDDKTLKVWELSSGRHLATLEGHTEGVTACAVTPDGRHVVSGSEDCTLMVWELASGQHLATLEGHTEGVTACAVTPDGRHVVSASDDKTLKVWELASGRHLATLEGHIEGVTACAVTPGGGHVVSVSDDHTLIVWELASGRALGRLEGMFSVTACAMTPDGCDLVSASSDRTLMVLELASAQALGSLEGHNSVVTACAVTPDGRHVVSASDDKTLKVWDLATHTCRSTHRGDTAYLAVAATAGVVVAGDSAGAVWFLDLPPSMASPSPHAPPPSAP